MRRKGGDLLFSGNEKALMLISPEFNEKRYFFWEVQGMDTVYAKH